MTNLEAFLKTAERIHTNRVQETQRWSEMGRVAAQKQTTAEPALAAKPFADTIKELRSKYGNEPFIDAMEAQHVQVEQARAFMEQSQARQQQAELQSLHRQVDSFFGAADMAPYHDHYGKLGADLSTKQIAEREKVLGQADLLIRGAASVGRSMTFNEAMLMAHDSVSSPIREKVATARVKQQASQRQASLTQRPGSRAGAQQAASRTDLEAKVKTGLASVFK
jgi:hypothetical protein